MYIIIMNKSNKKVVIIKIRGGRSSKIHASIKDYNRSKEKNNIKNLTSIRD